MATNGFSDDLSDSFAWMNTEDDVVEGVHTLNSILGGVYRIFYSRDLEAFFHYKPLVPEPPGELVKRCRLFCGGSVRPHQRVARIIGYVR